MTIEARVKYLEDELERNQRAQFFEGAALSREVVDRALTQITAALEHRGLTAGLKENVCGRGGRLGERHLVVTFNDELTGEQMEVWFGVESVTSWEADMRAIRSLDGDESK